MAENEGGGGTAGVVAIVAVFVLVMVGLLYAFRGRLFPGGGSKTQIDINISKPAK